MPPIQPTVLENGVSTTSTGLFNYFPYPDPTAFHTFWSDFDSLDLTNVWSHLFTNAAALATTFPGIGGQIRLQNSNAANDQNLIQLVNNSFSFEFNNLGIRTPKRLFINCRIRASSYANQNLAFGIATSGLGTTTQPLRFLLVKPPNAGWRLDVANNANTFTSDEVLVPANLTTYELGVFLDKNNDVYVYVDKKLAFKGNLPNVVFPVAGLGLDLIIYQQNFNASINNIFVDHILCSQER